MFPYNQCCDSSSHDVVNWNPSHHHHHQQQQRTGVDSTNQTHQETNHHTSNTSTQSLDHLHSGGGDELFQQFEDFLLQGMTRHDPQQQPPSIINNNTQLSSTTPTEGVSSSSSGGTNASRIPPPPPPHDSLSSSSSFTSDQSGSSMLLLLDTFLHNNHPLRNESILAIPSSSSEQNDSHHHHIDSSSQWMMHHFFNSFILPASMNDIELSLSSSSLSSSWMNSSTLRDSLQQPFHSEEVHHLQVPYHTNNHTTPTTHSILSSPALQSTRSNNSNNNNNSSSSSSSSSSGESNSCTNNNNANNNGNNNKNVHSKVVNHVVEYFPIACEQCRQQHRKCDKQLPKCYSCTQRGIECVYRESKRNKKNNSISTSNMNHPTKSNVSRNDHNSKETQLRNHSTVHLETSKSKSFHLLFSPYPLGKKSNEEFVQTSESLSTRAVIDYYFDVACDGYPLVSREELENFITYFPNCDDVEISSLQVNCEMFAMYFSIRALCECRAGLIEQSEKTIQKAKDCLSKVFDRISSSSVAAVYAHLVVYELYNGKTEQAKFYFTILDFLTKKLFSISEESGVDSETQSKLTIYEKNLEGWMYYYDTVLKLGLTEDFEKHTVEDLLIRLPEMYSFFCQEPLPQEWIHRLTKEKVTNENCFEIWSIVELLVNKFKNLEKSTLLTIPDTVNRADFVEPIYQIISDSLRIAILSKSQSPITQELIEKSALNIIHLTENPLYPLFPVDILFCVKPAVNIHLEICHELVLQSHSLGCGRNDFVHHGVDYYNILKKDLRSFTVMKPKFKAITKWINKITDQIEQMIAAMDKIKD